MPANNFTGIFNLNSVISELCTMHYELCISRKTQSFLRRAISSAVSSGSVPQFCWDRRT